MLRRFLPALLLAAGFALAVVVWQRAGAERRPAAPRSAQRAASEAAEDARLVAPSAPASAPGRAAEREVAATAPPAKSAPAAEVAVRASPLAELRGRLLFESGAPAAGVALGVHGWEANAERTSRFGRPGGWKDPAGTSDGDGHFSLRFDPPRAYQFMLSAKASGCAEAIWRWGELAPGEVKDLGDAVLPRGGAVEARIVDAAGRTLTQGWRVYAEAAQPPGFDDGRENTREQAHQATAGGAFRIEDLPPGPAKLTANSDLAGWIDGPSVEVRPGETAEAELSYSGPDGARRIVVDTSCKPFHVVDADAAHIHLYGADGGRRTAAETASQSHAFDDLPDGEYRVEIDDPRFLTWSKDGVRPGTSVSARLRGSASLAVEVVDDATGAPVPRWTAGLRFENVDFSPREFLLVEENGDPPAGGLLDGIVPGEFTLLVSAAGRAQGSAAVAALQPGETRRVHVRLGTPGAIAGVLRHAGGEAIPFADVELVPHGTPPAAPVDRPMLEQWRWEMQPHTTAALSDASGAFSFKDLVPGSYDLSSRVTDLIAASLADVRVEAGRTAEVVLEVPARCYLSGACLGPQGASFDGLSIEIEREQGGSPQPAASEGQLKAQIDAEGRYRVGPAPPGAYAVRLRLPDVARAWDEMIMRGAGPMRPLGVATLRAGENTGHDFDLRDAFPGRLLVRVTRGGAPAGGLDVRPFRVPPASEAIGGFLFPDEATGAALDEEGAAVLGPLLPGDYVVVAEGPGTIALAPAAVSVSPGGEGMLAFDATAVPGAFTVLDASTGEPLADHPLKVVPAPPPGLAALKLPLEVELRTDGAGRVAAELVAGPYRVFDGSNPFASFLGDDLGAKLGWDADGAFPSQLLLKRAESSGLPLFPQGDG